MTTREAKQTVLSFEECRNMATKKLSSLFPGAALYDKPIHSGAYGWVFSYQSTEYMRTNNISDAIIGNSPILVDRRNSEALVLGSGLPVEIYVENYLACGDPFKFLGARVRLLRWKVGAQKIQATRAIRRRTGVSLGKAKSHVDECLAGNATEIVCPSADIAAALIDDLEALGFCGEQLRD